LLLERWPEALVKLSQVCMLGKCERKEHFSHKIFKGTR
jgi:hypothetical protein